MNRLDELSHASCRVQMQHFTAHHYRTRQSATELDTIIIRCSRHVTYLPSRYRECLLISCLIGDRDLSFHLSIEGQMAVVVKRLSRLLSSIVCREKEEDTDLNENRIRQDVSKESERSRVKQMWLDLVRIHRAWMIVRLSISVLRGRSFFTRRGRWRSVGCR